MVAEAAFVDRAAVVSVLRCPGGSLSGSDQARTVPSSPLVYRTACQAQTGKLTPHWNVR